MTKYRYQHDHSEHHHYHDAISKNASGTSPTADVIEAEFLKNHLTNLSQQSRRAFVAAAAALVSNVTE